jgi:hypothetical protein
VSSRIDPYEVIRRAIAYDLRVGVQLWIKYEFGLRVSEVICLRPWHNDLGDALAVLDGTKGGRPHQRFIETASQRASLEAGKVVARQNRRGHMSRPGLTLAQAKDRFGYVMKRIGFTRKVLGTTPHGMRHDRLQQDFKAETGLDAPVKAIPVVESPVANHDATAKMAARPLTFADVDPLVLERAQYRIAHNAGHNRKIASAAYLGSIAAARRKALAGAPRPTVMNPQGATAKLIERLDSMQRTIAEIARPWLGEKFPNVEIGAGGDESDQLGPETSVLQLSAPVVSKSPSAATGTISAVTPAISGMPARLGLVARLGFGKKNLSTASKDGSRQNCLRGGSDKSEA